MDQPIWLICDPFIKRVVTSHSWVMFGFKGLARLDKRVVFRFTLIDWRVNSNLTHQPVLPALEILMAPPLLDPTEKPDKRLAFTIAEIILLSATIRIAKKTHQSGIYKYKKCNEGIQNVIQLCNFSPKRHLLRKYNKVSLYKDYNHL